jgi:hypothetical protein
MTPDHLFELATTHACEFPLCEHIALRNYKELTLEDVEEQRFEYQLTIACVLCGKEFSIEVWNKPLEESKRAYKRRTKNLQIFDGKEAFT